MATKAAAKKAAPKQIPFVNYLVLGKTPYLRAFECTKCGSRFFERRNACAKCFNTDFKKARVKNRGEIVAYSVVFATGKPFVSAIIDCDGTEVQCTLLDVEVPEDPSEIPEHVQLGMKVKLKTYSMGKDDDGTEAIGFGFAPA